VRTLLALDEREWNNGSMYTASELRDLLSARGAWEHSMPQRECEFAKTWSYAERLKGAETSFAANGLGPVPGAAVAAGAQQQQTTRDGEVCWCSTVMSSGMQDEGFETYGSRSQSALSSRHSSQSSHQVLHPSCSPHARTDTHTLKRHVQ